MKKLVFLLLLMFGPAFTADLFAEQKNDLSKHYASLSPSYSVPDNDQHNFADVSFRLGWSKKSPTTLAIQFVNHGYATRKFKFAIKDVTANKMIVLDPIHNSRFGSETLKANSQGLIWAGPIDKIKDSFSLHVWDSDGDEFDKEPIAIQDK